MSRILTLISSFTTFTFTFNVFDLYKNWNIVNNNDAINVIKHSIVIGFYFPIMIPTICKELYSVKQIHNNHNEEDIVAKYFAPICYRKKFHNEPVLPMSPDELGKIWFCS